MKILVVDDDQTSRKAVVRYLDLALGHNVEESDNARSALKLLSEQPFDVVLSDIRMSPMDGMELLKAIKNHEPPLPAEVVLMTGFASLETSVTAIRQGAFDYLIKPVDAGTLAALMDRLQVSINAENGGSDNGIDSTDWRGKGITFQVPDYGELGFYSHAHRKLLELALTYHEDRAVPVLITGETGTGKEGVARLVHHGRGRTPSPFLSLNCAAISPSLFESELFGYEAGAFTGANKYGRVGLLEAAQGGTVFLDEIGDLPMEMQPKLLRVLQEKELFRLGGSKGIKLDVRIIAATNVKLTTLVDNGAFRSDLYHRLNLGVIELPSLRSTREAILPLADLFLKNYAKTRKKRFTYIRSDTSLLLEEYNWPGNTRELKNMIERAVLLHDGETLIPSHLDGIVDDAGVTSTPITPPLSPEQFTLPDENLNLERLTREIIAKTLDKFKGNKSRAAQYLGLSRGSLRRKIDKFDL